MRHRTVTIVVLVATACAVGYGILLITGSTVASYIVGVVGMAVGIAALFVGDPRSEREAASRQGLIAAPSDDSVVIRGSVIADDGGVASGRDVRGGQGGIHTRSSHEPKPDTRRR
jgi:hypothetical protein